VVEDLREEFLTGYVARAEAGAVYENKYLLGNCAGAARDRETSSGSALREGATAVSHGCTARGTTRCASRWRISAGPELKVVAPWREWDLKSREDCLDYAEKRGISVSASREKIHSAIASLAPQPRGWRTRRRGHRPVASTWQMTSRRRSSDKEERVKSDYEKGVPVSVGGRLSILYRC